MNRIQTEPNQAVLIRTDPYRIELTCIDPVQKFFYDSNSKLFFRTKPHRFLTNTVHPIPDGTVNPTWKLISHVSLANEEMDILKDTSHNFKMLTGKH